MYDLDTSTLISTAPQLEELDQESLPDTLTELYARIASARIRFRDTDETSRDDLKQILEDVRRLAYTNEALVSALSNNEERAAAAFVAASAHQLCINAEHYLDKKTNHTHLSSTSISSDISAMLLFMIADATADAREMSKSLNWNDRNPIETHLILTLRDFVCGDLVKLTNRTQPSRSLVMSDSNAETAVRALYYTILEGVLALSKQILSGVSEAFQINYFQKALTLSSETEQNTQAFEPTSSFPGPHHLATLMNAVAEIASRSAITNISAPLNIDEAQWQKSLHRFARSRPFLWRNHLYAIEQGYLNTGTSSAISFPTGAGKSTLAELKINAVLINDKNIIFLAPTHALVDQTSRALSRSFPTASVQQERQDEFGFLSGDEELPEVLVMTPESCLTQISIDAEVFSDVGLVVFDECHLLHPSESLNDRRAIDSMLCILHLSKIANQSDFLLISAMMKNTEEIAEWMTELTNRKCLALSLPWKPTRQLRGSVVYHQKVVAKLQKSLNQGKRTGSTKLPPAKLKRSLEAKPLGLFSVKQTWATKDRDDYTLLELLDEKVHLAANKYWKLTPNAIAVSSAIAATSTSAGIKTLAFFQTIKNATSAAKQIANLLPAVSIKLTGEESTWIEIATTEMGGAEHLYLESSDGVLKKPTAVHHGLLLPEERHLVESLYKRADGIKVLTATSTLAQGMNLPSELVLIGEDSRFDQTQDKRQILDAQELLNAAGRAGRAGENSRGMVLVVPGKVVGIDFEEAAIGSHWNDLREIFGQSDQCLNIDDPIAAILDRVHTSTDHAGEIEKYTISRLAAGPEERADNETLSQSIQSSFGAYLAKKRDDKQWIDERVDSASRFYEEQSPETEINIVESQVAASLGLSLDLVSRLATELAENCPNQSAKVPEWRRWIFRWLYENPDLLIYVCRQNSLNGLFSANQFESEEERSIHAIPFLSKLTWLWMKGQPLCILEETMGTKSNNLKTCVKARQFVLRLIPELSFLFGLPALLNERSQANLENPSPIPSAVKQLGRCARLGFNSHEKAALHHILRKSKPSRRQTHDHYRMVKPYLEEEQIEETWEQTISRVEQACERELNSRGKD